MSPPETAQGPPPGFVDFGAETEDYKPPLKLEDIIDYRDLWGEYPRLLALRLVATAVLVYIMATNYGYHDPEQTYVTQFGRNLNENFGYSITEYILGGVALGMGFYLLSLLKGQYKRIGKSLILISVGLYILLPLLQGAPATEFEARYSSFLSSLFFMFLAGPALFGTYGIWRRRGTHIGISLIILIAIGFLYTGELERETTTGLMYGILFVVYLEIAFASIKYDAYVHQFRPAEQARSVLDEGQRRAITRRLDGLLFKFLILLAMVLFVTLTLAGFMLNLHDFLADSTSGPIANSIELGSIYGIVFVALLTFALLGIGRMFLSVERE